MADVEKVVVLGAGCAGYTAAIYTARANLNPLLISGPTEGGQLSLTSDIENYPGFPKGLGGMELMDQMKEQAIRFGARFVTDYVKKVDLKNQPFTLWTQEGEIKTQALVVCTGASARRLGLEGEDKFFGRGVSTCATCDGFFYREKEVTVVGGGDSAMEEGLFLTKFATKVTIIHRRDTLRASKIMQKRAFDNPKIEMRWNAEVMDVLGDENGGVRGVEVEDVKSKKRSEIPCSGFFLAIGHIPNTQIFEGQLELDDEGYLVTDRKQHAGVPGVFAGGDVQDHTFRQAVTAAGTGCAAAMEAEKYLASLGTGT